MTDTLTAEAHDHDAHEKHHPSDLDYVITALALAALTGMEITLSYVGHLHGPGLVIPLLILMAIKFVTVASRFMHLRFDSRLLTRVFYTGIVLAVIVYMIAMNTMHIWQKHGPIGAG